jgi:hypothetical protein
MAAALNKVKIVSGLRKINSYLIVRPILHSFKGSRIETEPWVQFFAILNKSHTSPPIYAPEKGA